MLLLMCGTNCVFASQIDEIKSLISESDYESALMLIDSELKQKPKVSIATELKFLAGECCFELGRNDEAVGYLNDVKARKSEAYRLLGKIDFMNYDFESSEENYDLYTTKLKKAPSEEVEDEIYRLQSAHNMFDRVENIIVIDSLNVAADKFFKFYRIARSSGSLRECNEAPFNIDCPVENMPFYINENEEFAIFSQNDSVGRKVLYESSHLIDGSWQDPLMIDFGEEFEGDALYPFMMSDGATLYFANNGKESIGGFDIFRSNRDVETHEYMSPQNMGMPYNSPYNDYMLAIDEENGVGWWATDRNCVENDMITIYVFIPNLIRVNRNIDDPNIVNYAKVQNYKLTWEEGADYSELLYIISQIDPNQPKKEIEFNFRISKDELYQNFDDFKTDEGRELMQQYLDAMQEFENIEKELFELRKKYNIKPTQSLVSEILRKEGLYKAKYEDVNKLRNKIYKVEK